MATTNFLRRIQLSLNRLVKMETEHQKRSIALQTEIISQLEKLSDSRAAKPDPKLPPMSATKVHRCPPMEWDLDDIELTAVQLVRLKSLPNPVNIVLTEEDIAFLTEQAGLEPGEI